MIYVLYLLIYICCYYLITITFYDDESCGILIEEYTYYHTVNIGDYIQSLAAMQFCNSKNIIYIERDNINKYNGKKARLIMNAWWRINKRNIYPSPEINPLYISYHLDNPQNITDDFINYLKKHEPIGCRDKYTLNSFSRLGIKSYFSGCLTLTLGNTYKNMHIEKERIIYITDCPLCYKYKSFLLNFLKNVTKYSSYSFFNMKHEFNKNITQKNRFILADSILKKYQSAYLVLTSRLHACLPCIAMNTSVILIKEKIDKRFSGLMEMTNYIIFNKTNININVMNNYRKIINPSIYLDYSSKLQKTVAEYNRKHKY